MFENAWLTISQLDEVKGDECKSDEFRRHLEQMLANQHAPVGNIFVNMRQIKTMTSDLRSTHNIFISKQF